MFPGPRGHHEGFFYGELVFGGVGLLAWTMFGDLGKEKEEE